MSTSQAGNGYTAEDARRWFDRACLDGLRRTHAVTTDMIEALLAATAPDPGPPRPDDTAELARLVAVELRSEYPDAREMNGCVCFTSRRPIGELFVAYPMHPHIGTDPAAIALHIQRDEIAMGAK